MEGFLRIGWATIMIVVIIASLILVIPATLLALLELQTGVLLQLIICVFIGLIAITLALMFAAEAFKRP